MLFQEEPPLGSGPLMVVDLSGWVTRAPSPGPRTLGDISEASQCPKLQVGEWEAGEALILVAQASQGPPHKGPVCAIQQE